MANLDTTDQQILKELQQNSKLSTKELASLVNLTPTPVFERQKRLEKEGYIKKYVAVLDPEKLGYGIIVLCSVKLKQHTRENGNQFMSVINQMDQVTECYNISGEYDFMMKVYVRDMKDYQDFVMNKLGSIDCIGGLQSIFVIGEAKHSNCIPIK
ncbi:MAG: Lrp/AsnC family transcriptional regulator [Paludibacteraceae bacterium]|nr:Lrp/AsnC family transcriptional regulator [Paludibacteraceae bacterium]MBR5972140.1 Lrp/AsnC family transcriptional regulator [Paludibacteraceae bacterium]